MIKFSYLGLFFYALIVATLTLLFNYLINGQNSLLNKPPKVKGNKPCPLKIGDVYAHLANRDENNPFCSNEYDYIIVILNVSESKKHNGDWYYQYVFLDKEECKPYSCGYNKNMIYSDKYENGYFDDNWEQLESIDVNTIIKS